MADKITVPEKQFIRKLKRSVAEKEYIKFIAEHGETALVPGQGKGKEPKPWCECHLRNPCPIDKELGLR